MISNLLNSLRRAADISRAIGDQVGLREHSVKMIKQKWIGVPGRELTPTSETVTDIKIYKNKNPQLRELSSKEVIASANVYQNNDIEIKLTKPYTYKTVDYGYDDDFTKLDSKNEVLLFEIEGPKYLGKFKLIEIDSLNDISLRLVLRQVGAE